VSSTGQRGSDGRLVRNAADLPRVQRGKDVHRVLEDLDEALSDPETGDQRLYQRGGELVIARGVMADDAKRLRIAFAPEALVLSSLRASSLIPRITEYIDYGFWGFEEKKAEDGSSQKRQVWKTELPSGTVLSAFLSKVFWAHARPIRGISVTPIIHLDGSIVPEGYDPKSQYLVASNIVLPTIPEHPTKADAISALAALLEPFDEFPFETEDERYSPVALALTLLLRPVIRGNVPAFAQTAPQKNCGKSLATKGACLLATGSVPASNTWAKLEEEQEKMIGAAADAGADVLFFDNVQEGAVIGGAPLDKVLTCDGQNSFRVLGLTKLKHLPWGAVVAFTANRARIGGDGDRRIVLSTLIRPDVPRENYRHNDLLVYIGQQRARLLGAAFTLVRAWIQDGSKPGEIRRLDSFEHWAQTVAAMIQWAGGGNVRELVRDIEGTDADGQEFDLLSGIRAWLDATGKPDTTVKELVDDVFRRQATNRELDDLRGAIETIAGFEGKGDARKLDVRRFGKRLAKMRDVLQGSYRLRQVGTGDGGVVRWGVVKVGGVEGVQPDYTREKRGVERQEKLGLAMPTNPSNPSNPETNGYPGSWDIGGGE
jgi:hypothetical protein